jgi:hypothetical protein
MSHFAKVNSENIVVQVIVAEQDYIDSLEDSSSYIQTSYNTYAGKHYSLNTTIEDDKPPLRKNYAGFGYTYNSVKDAFIPPKPFPSWTLDDNTCTWNPPVPMPTGKGPTPWKWDEDSQEWKGVVVPE